MGDQLVLCISTITAKNNRKFLGTSEKLHHLIRSRRLLFIFQIIDQCLSINIGTEAIQGKALSNIKSILSILIYHNMEGMGNIISVAVKNLKHLIGYTI